MPCLPSGYKYFRPSQPLIICTIRRRYGKGTFLFVRKNMTHHIRHAYTAPSHTVCRHTMTYSIKYHLLMTQAYHSFTYCTLVTKWDTLSSNIFRHYKSYSLIRHTFNWQGKSGQFLNCSHQVLFANNFNIMQFVVWTGSGAKWGRSLHTLKHYLHGMLVDTLPPWFSYHEQNTDLSSTFFLPKQWRHYTRWLEK